MADDRPQDDCPQCDYLRELAQARGTVFDSTQCHRCRPTGPRPKFVALYLLSGLALCVILLFTLTQITRAGHVHHTSQSESGPQGPGR
jgi:hypothetical protein